MERFRQPPSNKNGPVTFNSQQNHAKRFFLSKKSSIFANELQKQEYTVRTCPFPV